MFQLQVCKNMSVYIRTTPPRLFNSNFNLAMAEEHDSVYLNDGKTMDLFKIEHLAPFL